MSEGQVTGSAVSERYAENRVHRCVDQLIGWLREYASARINSQLIDERRCIPPYVVLDFGNRGLLGMQIPEEFGGLNLNFAEFGQVMEQLAAIDLSIATFVGVNNALGVWPVIAHAQPELRAEILPALAQGRQLAAFALTEVGAGSNPRAIETTAVPAGSDAWEVSGTKIWIGSASWASFIHVFARQVDENGKLIGMSGHVIRQGAAGLSHGPEALTLGMRGMVQNPVILNNVKTDTDHLLGASTRGMDVAKDTMERARFGLAAMSLGSMKRCLQVAARYADRRQVHTGRLLDNPVVIESLAEALGAAAALECLVRRTAALLDSGDATPTEIFLACKITGPEMLWKTADLCLQLCGGRGFIETNVISQVVRDSRVLRIFEGPTEPLEVYLGNLALAENARLPGIIGQLLDSAELSDRFVADLATLKSSIDANDKASLILLQRAAGRLANAAMLLGVSGDNDVARRWAEESYTQVLHSVLVRLRAVRGLPDSDQVNIAINGYSSAIGDVEQSLPGEDHCLDPMLRHEWTPA